MCAFVRLFLFVIRTHRREYAHVVHSVLNSRQPRCVCLIELVLSLKGSFGRVNAEGNHRRRLEHIAEVDLIVVSRDEEGMRVLFVHCSSSRHSIG